VAPVVTKKQQRQFLDLPADIHRETAQWVPRIRASERELAGFRHHAFHDTADTAAFLARRGNEPCGRIVAIHNRAHDMGHPDDSLGFVGFYECIDDAVVSEQLFQAAEGWLRERSITRVRGPVSPSMNYEAGLLVDGFDSRPSFMMPYNLPYVPLQWVAHGFEKVQDLFAFTADHGMLSDMNEKVRKISFAAVERFGAEFRQVDRRRFENDVQTFLELYNSGSAHTWGFVPLSPSEIKQLSRELKYLIIPELTALILVNDKVVGGAFAMLDYNPIIRRIKGRLFPFGFVKLLTGRKKLKKTRVMSINVLPEFQKWGLGLALMGYLARQGLAWGLESVEFSYVLESNHLACSSLRNGGARCEKTYRIYEKSI
jgi:GNAT superfamily N-acetyltransferase